MEATLGVMQLSIVYKNVNRRTWRPVYNTIVGVLGELVEKFFCEGTLTMWRSVFSRDESYNLMVI